MERKKLKITQTPHPDKPWDDTFRLMSWWKPEQVQAAKVMVVGAGALGNEVLKNLCLMNVGHVFIVDFDNIEYSNLCRSILFREEDIGEKSYKVEVAARRMKEVNPNIKVQTVNGDIMMDVGLGVFRRMDVIIGGLDNRLARLYINRWSHRVGRTWIDGAIENMSGQLCVYQPDVSCYECNLTETDWANIRHRLGCADVAQRNTAAGRVPTTPISSSIIAAMQVQEALKVIHGYEDKSMAGEHFKYDGMNNWIFTYKTDKLREICPSHIQIEEEEIVLAKELSFESTIEETLTWLNNRFGKKVTINLPYKVILEITTMDSEKVAQMIMAEPHFSEKEQLKYQEIPGERIAITKYVDQIEDSFPEKSLKLKDIGVPPLQILSIEVEDDIHFVELTGDEDYLSFSD